MDGKGKVAASAKSRVCVKHREASPPVKHLVLRVQQFPTWNKGDFSGWIQGSRRPQQKGLWAYLGTTQSRTSNPEFWVSHVLWKHKENLYPDSWVWWWSAASCSPGQFWEVFLEVPGRLFKEDQLMDCAVQACLTWDGQIWWSTVSSVNTPAHWLSQTAPNCLWTLLPLPHHIDWPHRFQKQLSRTPWRVVFEKERILSWNSKYGTWFCC